MNRNALPVALGALLLISLAVLAFGRDGAGGVVATGNSELLAAINRIDDKQTRLAERLDRIESLYGRSGTSPTHGVSDAQNSRNADNGIGPKRGGAPFASDQDAMAARQRLEMEDRLISDPLSPPWAMANEKTVADLLSPGNLAKQQLPAPKAFQTQCHSHLCRISMNFADSNLASQTQAMLLMEIAPTLPNAATFLAPQPDGSVEMVIFAGDPHSIH